ncbi:hypothetical protein B0H13DRAFT_184107 [Mycena leptocephala]|nr:hypothetical protein B0H13DRAFT_184107 [Mycena leptocephala]
MSHLPAELEREILELAARTAPDDQALRCRLMLIVRRTRIWIEPIIHELNIFLIPNDVDRFLELLKTKTTPAFVADHTKALCFGHRACEPFILRNEGNTSSVCCVLAACTGTRRLACWLNFPQDDPILGLIAQLPLRRLSMELERFVWLLNRYPHDVWLRNLTHLDLVIWPASGQLPDLTRLPSLTHLSFSCPPATPVRSMCLLLQVLIIRMDVSENFPSVSEIISSAPEIDADPRVVILPSRGAVLEWKNSWNGQPDMWTEGEAIVSERTRSSECVTSAALDLTMALEAVTKWVLVMKRLFWDF